MNIQVLNVLKSQSYNISQIIARQVLGSVSLTSGKFSAGFMNNKANLCKVFV